MRHSVSIFFSMTANVMKRVAKILICFFVLQQLCCSCVYDVTEEEATVLALRCHFQGSSVL